MRKSNPKHRWHLSDPERTRIRRLTLQRVPQSTIGRILGIGRDTVSKWQARMGLPTRVPVPEKKIMELFKKGWGGVRIAKHLKIAVSAVYKVAHKNKFRRADGAGNPEPKGDVAGFTEAVRRGQCYIKEGVRKYGVAFCQARKIAHEVRACPEFRRGLAKPPLSSNFPQKYSDVKLARPHLYLELVQRVLEKSFGGTLPAVDDARFVATMMSAFSETTLAGQPQPILDCFANGLREAVATLRTAQSCSGYVN
jgi:hypothetical protein